MCFCLFFLHNAGLIAQSGVFDFDPPSPNIVYVDAGCQGTVASMVPTVSALSPGAVITVSEFNPVASGFLISEQFTVPEVAHVSWDVADDMGHSWTFDFFVFFVDNSPPTFDLTGVFDTLEFSSVVQVPAQTALPISDNCITIVSDTFYQTTPPDTCQSGIFTRTWMATDENSNTAVFTQTIIIYMDTLPPLITGYPQDGSAACEQLATAYPAWRALQIATFAATDASGIKALTNNAPPTFPPGCKMPLTVMFKAIDNCMIQLPVMVTFTTSDTEGPVIITPPKDTVAYCSQSDNELAKLREWISTKAYSQVFDSCSYPLTYTMQIGGIDRDSAQVVTAFLASFANGCDTLTVGNQSFAQVHGFVSVNFFVEDDCGNSTFMGNADFGAIDTLPPVIAGTNITEQCGGGNDQTNLQTWINAHGNATVTEDCSDFAWTNFSFTTSSGGSGTGNFNAGPYPTVQANNCAWFTDVTFRATDDCGNSNTKTLRWTIIDTQVPTITGLAPSVTVYCPNPLPIIPAATVSDNCDASVAITFARIYKDSLCDGSYTVLTTWTATDDCGNSASATQNIFVRDTTKPVFTLIPPNKTFRCDTFVLPPVPVMGVDIMATDLCSPVVSINTVTASFQNPDPASCGHYIYNIVRTFTARDECDNTRTATQTISVIDNLGPVPGGILDTTALCSSLVPFPAPVPFATDACSGLTATPDTTMAKTITPGACTDQYTITVHWIASDVCGNTTTFNQVVHVIDTVPPTLVNIPPNITVECDAIPAPPNTIIFNATDNCDNAVSVNLVETEIRHPDPDTCAHWTDYIVKREWIATDNCGNSQTYTQLIQIEDTTPPAIVPPPAMMFPNDLGDCGANVTIPAPLSVTDVCSQQNTAVLLKDTMALMVVPSTNIMDTVVFQLTLPNLPPAQPVIGNATLTIFVDEADAETPQEFFWVVGETNPPIGITNSTAGQCGSSMTMFTISANQMNNWIGDGILTITLAPNNQSINAVCGTNLNRVRANLSYAYSSSDVPIDLSYTLDGGASQDFPPAGPSFLTAGTHTVVYTATDCAGNSSTSSVQITVNDTQPPSMAAPANITVFTAQNNCEGTVTLPFPVITENCAMSANLSLASAVLPLRFVTDPDITGFVAADTSLSLTGIVPNAVGTGTLKIRHKGDNAQLGEFFNVYDQAGNPYNQTAQGTMIGECLTFFETPITVLAQDINAWAVAGGPLGFESFLLATNRDAQFYLDFIGNCASLLPNQTDGISQVQVVLEYSYAVVDYSIKNALNQVVSTGTLTGNTTKDTLPPGNYTVMYMTTDNAGLTAMTSFALTVRDTVKPNATCLPAFIIQVEPSGAVYTFSPDSINIGSNDNCTPMPNLAFSVSPDTFICSQAGNTVNVILTVTDASGNSSTCQTMVGVTNTPPDPGYTPVCENHTLQLSANPPGGPYTYNWSGPGGYMDNEQDPVVTNNAMSVHEGTYCVTITGSGFCTSSACVVVDLAILDITPVLSGNGFSFCPGQTIVLSTQSFPGQNLYYQWLQDVSGTLVVLDTTTLSNFPIANQVPGTYTYYVKVFADGCSSPLSNSFMVTMHSTPPAEAEPEDILICEGQMISLQCTTPPTGGLTYMWTGPNGFSSTLQNPLVTNNAVQSLHAGNYILVTKRNGCFSNPDTVRVNINLKPPKPSISGLVNVCEGQTVTLVCSVANGGQWEWTSPTLVSTITNENSLQIVNVDAGDEGGWTVLVSSGGCLSDVSDPIVVAVQEYPDLIAGSNSPICEDSLLTLNASNFSNDPIALWCWTGPTGSLISNNQNPIIPNGASGTYQVVGKTSFGCTDSATVNVTNVVAPLITFIGNTAPACCDGTTDAMLLSTIVSAHGPLTYQWNGPGNPPFSTTDSVPVIGNVCVDDIGQYTLVVRDTFGCPSPPASTGINIQAPPATPTLQMNPVNGTVCAGDTLILSFTNSTMGATYTWNLPGGGTTTTSQPILRLVNAQPSQSGQYSVFATSADTVCTSGTSTPVTVIVNAIPQTPTISSNSPVCVGGTLILSANSVPGADYFWTGPFGFNSSQEDPVRMPVNINMEGEYKLRIEVNECTSAQAFLFVDVVDTPQTPLIADPPAGEICIDGTVDQFLNIINPVNGMMYTWENATSGIDFQSSTATSLFLGLPNVLVLGPGTHSFRVFATTSAPPGCNSSLSNTVSVRFDTIPAGVIAFAGLDRFDCVDSMIQLNGIPNPLFDMVTGLWTQIGADTLTILGATTPNASFFGDTNSVYTFRWSISNGACMNFSSDDITITAQSPETADGGPDIYSCDLEGIQLQATQGTTTQGKWVQKQEQAILGVVIDNPNLPNTTISNLPGKGQTYAFYWEIGNPGCGLSSDPVVVYVYSPKPNAGPTQFVCDQENCADLQASVLAGFEIGGWSSHDMSLTFSNPNGPNSSVCGLKPGANEIYWTINDGVCGGQSRDTVTITFEIFPQAIDDVVQVPFGGTAAFNALLNDVLPNAFTFMIATPPPLGRLIDTLADIGAYVYRPQSGFTGSETMTYTVSNNNCPGSITIGMVTFVVGGAPECYIPTVITPNGDGFNDLFTIPNICTVGEGGAELDVTIFNQWGDVVFHAKPYLNDWGGTYNSEELPAGTYFFVVKLNDIDKPKTGFLLIQR